PQPPRSAPAARGGMNRGGPTRLPPGVVCGLRVSIATRRATHTALLRCPGVALRPAGTPVAGRWHTGRSTLPDRPRPAVRALLRARGVGLPPGPRLADTGPNPRPVRRVPLPHVGAPDSLRPQPARRPGLLRARQPGRRRQTGDA